MTHEIALIKHHSFGKHCYKQIVLRHTLLDDIVDVDVGYPNMKQL